MTYVLKKNFEKESFRTKKVYDSVKKSGGSGQLAAKIAELIKSKSYPGIKTEDIEGRVAKILKKEDPALALRFGLKKGLKRLGPSGFPFEKYVARVLQSYGYKTKINQFLKGKCCQYEIDFIAEMDGITYIGECKYRNLREGKVHSGDALANYARFLDLSAKKKNLRSILVTNSRFTSKAIKYCHCVGVEILGWKTPKGHGLEKMIEERKLYPITVLPGINQRLEEVLIEAGIILTGDLAETSLEKLEKITGLAKKELNILLGQAKSVDI